MHDTEYRVAVLDIIDDDAYRDQIEDFIDLLVLIFHLFVDAVIMFRSAVNIIMQMHIVQRVSNLADDQIDGRFALFLTLIDLFFEVLELLRMQIFECQILKLKLDFGNTEPAGKRRVNFESFVALFDFFLGAHVLHGPHVVQSVRQLDDQDADVLGHCQKHLAEVLRLYFLFGFKFNRA